MKAREQQYECPTWFYKLLNGIKTAMEPDYKEWGTPFSYSGQHFKNDVFEVHSDHLTDDPPPYNFKCGDIQVSWYRWLGRQTTINRIPTLEEGKEIHAKCLESLNGQKIYPDGGQRESLSGWEEEE